MLKYHNDGKEKCQSHEVYESELPDIIHGYGATKEEAFKEFKSNVEMYIGSVQHYYDEYLKIEKIIKVDCFGKSI